MIEAAQQTSGGLDLDLLRQKLRTSLVSDALDLISHGTPRALGPEIRPLDPSAMMIGWAFPVAVEAVEVAVDNAFDGLLAALDAYGPDDVYCVSSSGLDTAALWGELLSTRGVASGAAGAVCDGYIRDVRLIRQLGFTCFSRGVLPVDMLGRYEAVAHNVPVTMAGIVVQPRDLVVGDEDGVVIVPQAMVAEVVELALAKAEAEDGMRQSVADGVLPSVAYSQHKVL